MLTSMIISGIKLYQKFLSPLKGTTCRFYPSCSHYSIQSLLKHGLIKGIWFTARRLARCHPYQPGGYDPVK